MGKIDKSTMALANFLIGMGSILDVTGVSSLSDDLFGGFERDRRALIQDWNAVGKDIWDAIAFFDEQSPQ